MVSGLPEPSPGEMSRLFGVRDEPHPRRPLPQIAAKRSRASSSSTPTTSSPIPISWASRPVDLNAQRPVGAGYKSPPRVLPSLPRRHITSISTVSTPISPSFSTPTSVYTSGGPTSSSTSIESPAPSFTSRSHSNSKLGIRRERSLDGFHTTSTTRTRLSPPLSSSPVPLGLSFARLASVSPPSQSVVAIGCRDRRDTVTGTRPTFRSLPYKSPTTSDLVEPIPGAKTINTSPLPMTTIATIADVITREPEPIPRTKTINAPPMTTSTPAADVITRPAVIGPRSIGGKQKLQLSLQIPSIPMLGQEQEEAQNRDKKPQLPALKLITDTILHPASTASSPSIKLSPSPLSYVSYSHPHSPVSPAAANAKPSSSPAQLSPTHSLLSADSRIHLHPLSLSSPISGSASGSASVRTSVGWVIGGTGGGVSPGGRSVKSLGGKSVNSLGGRRPRSARSTRSMRSNRSRRSTNNKIKSHNIPVTTPVSASNSTPTAVHSTDAFAYTHLGVLGDHVGEFVGDRNGKERDGFVYGGYGYIEDGWDGGRSPSPIRYARSDSRGILNSDTEDDDGDHVYGGGVYGGKNGGEHSAASSEVEFADVDGDSDSGDRVRRRRRSRRWKESRDRRRGTPTTTTTTNPSSPSLPAPSHHSSHPSSNSNPSASSPLSSSSSANSYSNPYSTRKDRKRARKIQLRSFRNSYRMPPVVPLDQERGRGRGEEKKRGGRSNRTSSPVVMKSMIPFRRKTPPLVTGEEQVAQDSANASTKKKKKKSKSKSKDKEKGLAARTTATKRKPTKSAIDLFNSVSASMSYSASASASQSASTSVLSGTHYHPRSSSSVPPLPVPPSFSSHSIPLHSQSGSGSTFNTRSSSPDLIGRKPTNNTARKKFAESVSSALEEVTSRGRASGAPFQPASKAKALTAYSSGSHSIPFDEMEVLDISRLSGGGGDGEGSPGGGKTKAVMAGSSSFDEMEVLDISLPGGSAEAEQQTEKGKEKEIPRLTMTMAIKNGGVVRTTSSSLPESDRFPTVYSSKVSAVTTANSNPQQQPQFRGNEGGATTNRGSNSRSSGSNRRQYSHPQPPYNRNSLFQLQPAYTAGISCGLPVSRPQPFSNPRSRSPPRLPTPPLSAPVGGVSSPSSSFVASRSVRLFVPVPPFSAPVITVSDSGTSDNESPSHVARVD